MNNSTSERKVKEWAIKASDSFKSERKIHPHPYSFRGKKKVRGASSFFDKREGIRGGKVPFKRAPTRGHRGKKTLLLYGGGGRDKMLQKE